jgi:hypothetical protein
MNHERALKWARRHIEVLKADVRGFEEHHKGPLVTEPQAVIGEYLVKRPDAVPPFPPDWVFQVGDCLHGLRVALDYLAFAIVQPVGKDAIKNTAFPICRNDGGRTPNWGSLSTTCLPGLDAKIVAKFYDLQPSIGTNNFGLHPLALLDELENIHKHREPLRVSGHAPVRGAVGGLANYEIIERFPFSPDKGAPVYRVRTSPPDASPNSKFYAPVRVCFDKIGIAARIPVINALERIDHFVGHDVFNALATFAKP